MERVQEAADLHLSRGSRDRPAQRRLLRAAGPHPRGAVQLRGGVCRGRGVDTQTPARGDHHAEMHP